MASNLHNAANKCISTALLFMALQLPTQHCSITPAASFLNLIAYNLGQSPNLSKIGLVYTNDLQAGGGGESDDNNNYYKLLFLSSMIKLIKPT